MKKNINVIQIKGIKGIIIAAFVVTCLAAGFISFPGIVCTKLWNLASAQIDSLPAIGILQGVLLWAILVVSYFVFRKDNVVVCLKSPQGLSEEELKSVFADLKKQSQEDPILQAMLKARESELKIKSTEFPQNETESTTQTINQDK